MGSTFFGLVDMGLLGSPMGPLGSPSLTSYFTLFRHNIFTMKNLGLFGGEIGWIENFGEKIGMKTFLECDWLDGD